MPLLHMVTIGLHTSTPAPENTGKPVKQRTKTSVLGRSIQNTQINLSGNLQFRFSKNPDCSETKLAYVHPLFFQYGDVPLDSTFVSTGYLFPGHSGEPSGSRAADVCGRPKNRFNCQPNVHHSDCWLSREINHLLTRVYYSGGGGGGGTPLNLGWGCAAEFLRTWPCSRLKRRNLVTLFQTKSRK